MVLLALVTILYISPSDFIYYITESLNFFFFISLSFFLVGGLCGFTYGILVLWPGMEPVASAVKALSPNHWTTREFPTSLSVFPHHLPPSGNHYSNFCSSEFVFFKIPHVSDIIQYLSLSDFFSFFITPSNLSVVSNGRISYFSQINNFPLYIDTKSSLFLKLTMDTQFVHE